MSSSEVPTFNSTFVLLALGFLNSAASVATEQVQKRLNSARVAKYVFSAGINRAKKGGLEEGRYKLMKIPTITMPYILIPANINIYVNCEISISWRLDSLGNTYSFVDFSFRCNDLIAFF